MMDHYPLSCPWYARWWHRRSRHLDETFMIPAIVRASQNATVTPPDPTRPWRAFDRFIHQRGQEHWLCACGADDRARVEEGLRASH